MTNHIGCEYLRGITTREGWEATVERIVKAVKATGIQFDAIAFRGMSGALLAPVIASHLGKEMLMVRKSGDDSHSSYKVEGNAAALRYIIVDDLIFSGKTIRSIISCITDTIPAITGANPMECVGIFLYSTADDQYRNPTFDNIPVFYA